MSVSTAWRYVRATTRLLAQLAPTVEQGTGQARRRGHAYVVVDGTLIPGDHLATEHPFSSSKHHWRGMNVQVAACPDGGADVGLARTAGGARHPGRPHPAARRADPDRGTARPGRQGL
ncbi:hypothetical protein [Thermobifida halotolerans]|uniref:hypothetical protein n=1 Tax=Thermobifida halotolerans TaxID=483545 RepID=UPI001F2A3850|nr:hypothetical protein [Thermobifida halotolerans]